jgi:hypothetical protein
VGEGFATPDDLELAVSGLSGFVGFLLLPTLGAWLRLVLQWLESGYAALGRSPRLSGRGLLIALGLSVTLVFFMFCLGRGAGELREVRLEAPVFATTLTGIVAGISVWVAYFVGWRWLRRDFVASRRQVVR